MPTSANGSRPHVVVLGGGFAGLEGAYALRQKVGERARITLVSDQDHFLFRPNSIYVPFGLDPAKLRVPLAKPLAARGIEYVSDRAVGVDIGAGRVELEAGAALPYDRLVIATGSGMRPEEIPGLAEHAEVHLDDRRDAPPRDRPSPSSPSAAEPAGAATRPLRRPAQQQVRRAALRDRADARDLAAAPARRATAIEITWSTFESSFIQAFGPRLHERGRRRVRRAAASTGHTCA